MTNEWLEQLPASHARQIKTATVPPHLLAMFAHLPQELHLEASLGPEAAHVPMAARQLIKLSVSNTRLHLRGLSLATGAETRVSISYGERRCTLGELELNQGITAVIDHVLQSLFDRAEFLSILRVFAFQSSNLSTLQKILSHMLQSTDVDKALYVMLSGITSGPGLGFNRAVLFIYEESRRAFVGSKAIGPADEAEAHRIWEEIAYEDKSIDRLIEDYQRQHFDTRFQQYIQGIELAVHEGGDDEVIQALATTRPLLFRNSGIKHEGLKRLGVANEFVLAALRPHGNTLGLIYADNLYSKTSITGDQLTYFSFFNDQTAMVWENLSLLRRVEQLARYDGLTGVFNRREFEARFQDEKSRALRSQSTCSLMIMDVDLFKEINDKQGHQAGDEILRRLGSILRQTFRTHDVIGRFGGDEFIVLLPQTSKEQLAQAVRRIGLIARENSISLSIGGANWPLDCADPTLLLTAADTNLYHAKRNGRCRAYLGNGEIRFQTSP